MEEQKDRIVPSLDPTEKNPSQTPDESSVVNLDSPDEQAKQDMRDDESLMDFGSGSGGGSAGDGGAA